MAGFTWKQTSLLEVRTAGLFIEYSSYVLSSYISWPVAKDRRSLLSLL